jgi:prepilin-type N-terminal cleavage/methylation domain-containing protein
MKRHTSAFTLVELLTVIAIIGVLMALLFPIMGTVKNSANKAVAATDISSICGAVKGYQADYGYAPIINAQIAQKDSPQVDTMFGDREPQGKHGTYFNNQLFDILRGLDTTNNPKQTVYFDAKSAKGQTTTTPHGGILDNYTGGNPVLKSGMFLDPWGARDPKDTIKSTGEYVVWVDANNTGYTNLWGFYNDDQLFMDPKMPAEDYGTYIINAAGAASLGKDGEFGKGGNKVFKGSDDIVSW